MKTPPSLPVLAALVALIIGALVAADVLRRPASPESPDARAPDVVVVVLDTLRPDHLGCYGYGRPTSPNIDAFAEGAVVFEQAESAAPWTAPALISLMTSLHPDVHGVLHHPGPGRMSARVTTLAELLKERGYATGAFTEGGYAKGEWGLDQGFDVFPDNDGDESSNDSNMSHASRLEGNLERALAWFEEHAGQPRFMLFHTYEVHEPLRAPDEFVRAFRPDWDGAAEDARLAQALERFSREGLITPEDVQLLFDHKHHCLGPTDERIPQGLQRHLNEQGLNPDGAAMNRGTLEFFTDQYDAEIRYTDDRLARLLQAVGDDSIVVLVSDHGEAIGEHGKIGHGSRFHREQIGVALIVRAPGVAPRRVPELVRSIDVMPTVLELSGLAPGSHTLQGRSLVPAMKGEELEPAPSFSHGLGRRDEERSRLSVRTSTHRAILSMLTGEVQLYDLAADPGETRDLAGELPELAQELAALIREQLVLDAQLATLVSGAVEPSELDPETIERLTELGYFE